MTTLADFNTAFASREQLRGRNQAAVEYLQGHGGFPRPDAVVPRADGVYVTVADLDALGLWMATLGGDLSVTDLPSGFRVWVLVASTPWTAGSVVQIRVSVVSALTDDELPVELRTGAAA
jgi:hypothetical protein